MVLASGTCPGGWNTTEFACQTLNCSVAGTAGPSSCACKANFYGDDCTRTIEDDIAPGFCKDFHRAAIAGLGTTYISALSALALFCSFLLFISHFMISLILIAQSASFLQ